VGSSSTDAGSPAASDSSSAGTPDSVFLLMSGPAPARAVPTSMADPGSGDEASSLQASEQGAAAAPSAGDTTLPDTGGANLWKGALGFLLLSLGLLLVARRARRSPLTQ
jgi:LPXTG-motif cell wall-anchored protein